MTQDLPDDQDAVPTAEELYADIVNLVRADPDNERLLGHQVHAASHLISLHAENKNFAGAINLYKEVFTLAERHAGYARLRETLGNIAVMLTAYLGDAGAETQAEIIYREIKALSEKHPDEASIREISSGSSI